jgi:hypothetical protein
LHDADPNDCSAGDGLSERLDSLLRGKGLRELTDSDLLDYFYLAVDHVGSGEDFKFYLPRILEIMASARRSLLDGRTLVDKLRSARFGVWPEQERRVVLGFVQAAPAKSALAKIGGRLVALAITDEGAG